MSKVITRWQRKAGQIPANYQTNRFRHLPLLRRDFFGQIVMKIFFSLCSQASYYSQASEALSDLTNKLGWKKEHTDEDCQQQLQQKLAEIKALSIVEDG